MKRMPSVRGILFMYKTLLSHIQAQMLHRLPQQAA